MKYAILQANFDPLPLDKLADAIAGQPGLTRYDAQIIANDAFGILLRNQDAEVAHAIHGNLLSQGIQTILVPEPDLPVLPAFKIVRRVECLPECLHIYDAIGRPVPIEWRHVLLVAAGAVNLSEFNTTTTIRKMYTGDGEPVEIAEQNTKEERNARLVLEIVLAGEGMRFQIMPHQSPQLLFKYLADRRTQDLTANFRLLIQDLLTYAPHAAMTRGAFYLRENADRPLRYPSKTAFYEEITWLLWQLRQARQPGTA